MGKILKTEVEKPEHMHRIAVSMSTLVIYLLICLLVIYLTLLT